MKKIIMFLTAAMFAVGGVNAQKEERIWLLSGNPEWGQCTVNRPSTGADNIELHFRSQWSGFPIATNVSTTEYKGVSIEYDCSINTAGVQITVGYNKDDTQYNASIGSNDHEYSISFSDAVITAGTAKSIAIWQGGAEGKCDIVIKKAYLVKTDGTKQQITTLPSDSWENSAYLSGEFNFKAKWNGATLKDDNSQNITFSSSLNQTHIYTVLLDEAAPIDLTLLPEWKEGDTNKADYTHVISAGQNSATFVFTPEYDNKPTNMVFWTGVETGFPAKVKVNSITRGIINHTSSAVANEGSSTYWGTYSNNLANVEFSDEDVEVYNVTIEGEKLKFTRRGDNKVAKGEGVIVKCKGESFNVKVIKEEVTAAAANKNLLKATPTTVQTIPSTEETLYYLTKNTDGKLGFYWRTDDGKSLPNAQPGKAYLAIPNLNPASKTRSIDIDDPETTDIEGVKAERVQHDAIYNLAGQRVGKLSKGINIVGNKKVLVK